MQDDTGLVVETSGDTITVQMKRASACSRCGSCKIWGEQEMLVEAINTVGARLNDRVRVTVGAGPFLKALGILYGIPFVAMMIGFFGGTHVGYYIGMGEYAALAGFAAGMAGAYLGYRLIKAMKGTNRHRVEAVEVV